MAASRLAASARRAGPIAAWAVLGAVATLQALWMLLLGLAMAFGNPLGATDSDWRTAAGVGLGCSAVLFGAGLAWVALGRRGAAAVALAAGAGLYSVLYLLYPRVLDEAMLWVALVVPWVAAGAAAAWWRRGGHSAAAAPVAGPADPAAAELPGVGARA